MFWKFGYASCNRYIGGKYKILPLYHCHFLRIPTKKFMDENKYHGQVAYLFRQKND